MRRWLRLVPVVLMGVLAIAYVLARPTLRSRIPYLDILEFPIGAAIVAILLWAALARRRPASELPVWRKHAQVVRELPDPALRPDMATLERWVDSGEGAEAAADVLARARSPDPVEQQLLKMELVDKLTIKASRRKRETMLRQHLEQGV